MTRTWSYGVREDDVSDEEWRDEYEAHVSQTLAPWGLTRHLWVRRRDDRDGIGWDVLQQIKNEMLGHDTLAVEIYPAAAEVINEFNYRHLWEVPDDILPIGLGPRQYRA